VNIKKLNNCCFLHSWQSCVGHFTTVCTQSCVGHITTGCTQSCVGHTTTGCTQSCVGHTTTGCTQNCVGHITTICTQNCVGHITTGYTPLFVWNIAVFTNVRMAKILHFNSYYIYRGSVNKKISRQFMKNFISHDEKL
jgi:hypothetical protein